MRSGQRIAPCLLPLARGLCLAVALASVAHAVENRIDLGGRWQRLLGGELHDIIAVPSSYRPIGMVTLKRSFDLRAIERRRVLLNFEGITYQGEVRVNGAHVGSMGPWTPYRFDVTEQAHQGSNQIEVEISDSQVALGPTGGWESYGGIIRAVSSNSDRTLILPQHICSMS